MKLTATCQVCGKVICQVVKDAISADDIQLYQDMSSCETDGQADVAVIKTEE